MGEDGGANIYDDLPDFRYDKTLDQLNAVIAKLEADNHLLQSRLVEITEEKNVLEGKCRVLTTNISSLLKTAKLEIKRKERDIANLREQLNAFMPQRRQFGTKRRRETRATPSPRKKPKFSPRKVPEMRKFSPRKVREERLTSRIRDTESNSKPKIREVSNRAERDTLCIRASRDNKTARDERPTRVETERRDHLVTGKENAPITNTLVSKEPQVNGNSNPSPAIATPSLPLLQCPTVFSRRMFSRIYGRECERAFPTLTANPSGSIDMTPVDGEPQKTPTVIELHPSGSSDQRPSPSNCSRIAPEKIRIYLGMEDSLNSDGSESSASVHSEVKPVATSHFKPRSVNANTVNVCASKYVKPQDVNVKISSKVTEADLKPEHRKSAVLPLKKLEIPIHQQLVVEPDSVPLVLPPEEYPEHQKRAKLPLKKLEQPVHQPPVIEPHSVTSIPPDDNKDNSSEVNLEQSSAKSPPAKIGLLAVGKTRQQIVATIRPIQKLAAQEIPGVVGKPVQNRGVKQVPKSSDLNSPESKTTEVNSGVCSAEKCNRHLKIPGLSGSAKGRTSRQVFAPISNQWNFSHPGDGNQNHNDKKSCSELPIVKSISVTSELTVRVEDSKLDELKKQSSTEALFGSPLKWADDSLDSPMTEGSANSRRLYSIFGSPLKSFDSNSSEHPFSVPPAAYEDSCWTNQVPEKMPTCSSAGDTNIQKQSKRSQEPVTEGETTPKEKSPEQNDTDKVTTRSFFPPPPLSVIKKHVSIFSPVKDSKLPVTSHIPDEPSRSNTGICFPFPRPKYEDSVLGQFDDTAQFVSALAKVDTQISPLSTPTKSGVEYMQSVIVEKNPTSFQQVFKKNGPGVTHQIHEPSNLGEDTVGIISAETTNLPVLAKASSNEEPVLSRNSCSEDHEISNRNETIDIGASPKSQKIVEPPTITITPPNSESSVRIINRPNFTSSTSLSVKSWFPDAPVKMVTPRKTPRLVSSVNRSASPKGLEVSAGSRFAINAAFFIGQEERVRRWELDLYENARRGSGSPMKGANGSPTRKRIETPGKTSPSKRSPKKQISPCKSLRRADVHRDIVVDPTLQCTSGAVTESRSASNKDSTLNQLVPCSANLTDTVAYSVDAIPSQIPTEPIKSVPNSTQKVLTMIGAVIQKHIEPGFESASAEANKPEEGVALRSVDVTSMAAKSEVEDKDTVVHKSKSRDCFGPEPPSGPTLKQEIVRSQVAASNHTSCLDAVVKEACLKNATNEQSLLVNPPGYAESCPETSRVGSADPHGSSSVKDTKTSKILPDPPKPNGNRKQQRSIQRRNDSTASTPITSSKSISSSELHTKTPDQNTSEDGHQKKRPIRKKIPSPSELAALVSRVKPSTPLTEASRVAAMLSSSISSKSPALSRPLQAIIPIVQSSRRSTFKRSSALKSDTKKNTGNNLMNSIRSTFFQGTPTSSKEAGNSGAETQTPQPNIQPKMIGSKRKSNLSVNSTNTVSLKSTTHNPVVAPLRKRLPALVETAGSRGSAKTAVKDQVALSKTALDTVARCDLAQLEATAESVQDIVTKKPPDMKCNIPGQWKLLEVDHHSKPISLLQRFQELKEGLLHPLDLTPKEKSKVENRSISPAAQYSVLNGALERTHTEKPETQHTPRSNGIKVLNRVSAKVPPKSPIFPRSSRRTILLDSPLKMETPTKAKKRGRESIGSPKPREKCGESSKSSDSKDGEPKSGKKARTASGGRDTPENSSPNKSNKEAKSRTTNGRKVTAEDASLEEFNKETRSREVTPEKTLPQESNKKHAEPRRSRVDSPGHSRGRSRDHRSSGRSRDRRSRGRSRDRRSRDRAQDHDSRGRSRDHRSREQSQGHRSRHRSQGHRSICRSQGHRSKGRSPAHRSRGRSRDHRSRDRSRDHRSRDSSSESADENPRTPRPESEDDAPVVQITASAPRQKAAMQIRTSVPLQQIAPVADFRGGKVNSAQPQNPETPCYTEFCASAGIASSTARPRKIQRIVQRNFSSASSSRQINIVICSDE